MAEPHDERVVHRLEAFSDIVIGFSLAQLGASLALTKGMTLDATGVLSFLFAFGIICSLWFFHHRLFEHFFVPKTIPMLLNFAWLAVVVLLVFVAQAIPRHYTERGEDLTYFGLYMLAYGILAVQAIIGLRERRDCPPEHRVKGVRQIAFMSYWTLIFATVFAVMYFMPATAAAGNAISVIFAVGAAGSLMLGRTLQRLNFRHRFGASNAG